MLVPVEWLNDFVDLDKNISTDDIVAALMEHSCEIEQVIDRSKGIENVVIGKILSLEKHPDADKLQVCAVSVGNKTVQIVTGATNVKTNDLIPVALDGALLPTGLQIKTTKLRGVLSEGMLCSEKELKLSDEASGIMILPSNSPVGMNIVKYLKLDRPILNLAVLPNRGDLLSIKGIARELSVIYNKSLKETAVYKPGKISGKNSLPLKINIEAPNLCSRYMGVAIKGIQLKSSPQWMQERLKQADVKPINNIVDITNYVMLELGQPLHAFTYEQIKNSTIVVREAGEKETITLLNDEQMALNSSKLVIADNVKPIALAGIMGGKYSSIDSGTRNIIIESAYFNPASIRKTAFSLALRTESSQRFEKGVDWQTVELAMLRAIELVLELAGGEVASEIVDVKTKEWPRVTIPFNSNKINSLLGTNLSKEQMTKTLSALGFDVTNDIIYVPTFRQDDVYREADIAEEIGRIYGYNNVITVIPPLTDFSKNCNPENSYELNNKLRELLTGYGANEIVSYSMASPDEIAMIYDKTGVFLKNPLNKSESLLRCNLFISLLKNFEFNNRNLVHELKTFELGHVYFKENEKFMEEARGAALFTGRKESTTYEKLVREYSFPDIKGLTEDLLKSIGIKKYQLQENKTFSFLHPYRSCEIRVGKDILAVTGEVHSLVKKHYDFRKTVCYSEFFIDNIKKYISNRKHFQPYSLYPTVKRDISFWIDKVVVYETILKTINQSKAEYLSDIILSDIYDGKKYGDDKINYALSLIFQSQDSTLTEEQVNHSFQKIIQNIQKQLNLIFA
ncbi:MAG: phenylalanine--tRNA ligase subunit beta [Candidatus Margulisbacteria bacterium]|nr:phenylalanine--tRNA ligase subunit beta [Candidatus Margulisiibacteriota bacterium]